MKSRVTSTAHAVRPSFMQKLIAFGTAALLAVASLGTPAAWADEAPVPTSLKGNTTLPVERANALAAQRLATPELPLMEGALQRNRAKQADEHTMTFYYYELVHYEDPEVTHPDNLRLLYTRTVEGLSVGDVLDTWDYVDDINGYFFWDAWPAKPVVSEDESRNIVELFYMNPELNAYTVNYYRVSDGADEDGNPIETPEDGSVVEEIDGVALRFDHLCAETIDGQYYNKKVVGAEIAPELESMVYLDSFPQAIRVQTNHEDNVINLLYTDDHLTLPDRVEVPDDLFAAVPEAVPSQPAPGVTAPGASVPGTSAPSNKPSASAPNGTGAANAGSSNAPTNGNKPVATGPTTSIAGTGTSADGSFTTTVTTGSDFTTTVTFAETGTDAEADLAQTSDTMPLVAPIALVLAAAGAVATLAYRRSH